MRVPVPRGFVLELQQQDLADMSQTYITPT